MKCNCPERPKPYTHTLTVEKPATTEEASGQIDLNDDANWIVVGRIRGRAITKGGMETARTETVANIQKQAYRNSEWRTPWSAISNLITENPTWRLRLGTRKLNIVAACRIDEISKEVQIIVKERV